MSSLSSVRGPLLNVEPVKCTRYPPKCLACQVYEVPSQMSCLKCVDPYGPYATDYMLIVISLTQTLTQTVYLSVTSSECTIMIMPLSDKCPSWLIILKWQIALEIISWPNYITRSCGWASALTLDPRICRRSTKLSGLNENLSVSHMTNVRNQHIKCIIICNHIGMEFYGYVFVGIWMNEITVPSH